MSATVQAVRWPSINGSSPRWSKWHAEKAAIGFYLTHCGVEIVATDDDIERDKVPPSKLCQRCRRWAKP